jgi:SAM-dependent methyltransferase
MTNIREDFYETYWSNPAVAIPTEDATTSQRQRLLKGALEDLVGSPSRGRTIKILDAGCGNGEFTRFIAQCGYETAGIDIAEAAVKRARSIWPEGKFCKGSLEHSLPFDSAEFDAIWSTEVLEHLFDVHASLSEFNRVLQEDGILILTVPFHGLVKNLTISLIGFEKHYNPYISHIRFFTKKSLTDVLNRTGFEPIQWKGIGRTWPLYKSLFVVARKVKGPETTPKIIG